MDGVFIRKKPSPLLILILLCGIFFIALYIFLNIVDSEAAGELLTFFVFGVLLCLVTIPSMLLNHGAYIHIEENAIHAKYHWFGRLDCNSDEVAFVLPQINTLTILLKNGKRHVIMGIENGWLLASAIRRQIFAVETETPNALLLKLETEQAAHKKKLFWFFGSLALMFVNIFIAAFLTGGREMHDFSKLDWTLFAMMGVVEVLTVLATFYFAQQCGKHLLPIEQLKYRLKGAYIASQPLLSGNARRVYTDENHTGRIVVCGYPNDENVYYCVQAFVGNFLLKTTHTSESYENEDVLTEEADFDSYIDITEHFQ